MRQPNGNDIGPSQFYREYDLVRLRSALQPTKEPAQHQKTALEKLQQWYVSPKPEDRGGILVLPTGGGKTFTCAHFTCRHPISDGFKVLWLAHTHHLLEQALNSFDELLRLIAEPRSRLSIRVVSGASEHFGVRDIRATDDVVFASLQTTCKALNDGHKALDEFLDSAAGNLFVVFDEAHHSPAPSYRRLLQNLRAKCQKLVLLGLTATPTYSDEKKRGWLSKLFPQGIVHQETPQRLMAQRVLAKPVIEEARTKFEPDFSDREYKKWLGSNRDVPEEIIQNLAENRSRNEFIVQHYIDNRQRYGKTLIFADRWAQCEAICTLLGDKGVRAGAVFSHVVLGSGSVTERNRRTPSDNALMLEKFRRGELDVLVNIKMLTEGTDVPDVQTVFLTRQTTSQILLTQMVGRALRGPEFGGTDKAYIVSFIDDWKHRINWAAYDQIGVGRADDGVSDYGKRPPISLISIDLIRRLARQMDSGKNISPEPYRTFLPVGWYLVDFDAVVEGSDDIEPVRQLVLAYEHDKPRFDEFICMLKDMALDEFADITAKFDGPMESRLSSWKDKFFGIDENRLGAGLLNDMLSIVRHVAQNEKDSPIFFPFEKRDEHDLDGMARVFLDKRLSAIETRQALNVEYNWEDRYWTAIYPAFQSFVSDYQACESRILEALENNRDPETYRPNVNFTTPESLPEREPSEDVKEQVKSRDGYQCRCCGCDERRWLQVDHIQSWFHQGGNHLRNLQTLCKTCNGLKGTEPISFMGNQTALLAAPTQLPAVPFPPDDRIKEREQWEIYLRRWINFFFRCVAVDTVEIGGKGERLRTWRVRLFPGNDPSWLAPHLVDLAAGIRDTREEAGFAPAPELITINEPRPQTESNSENAPNEPSETVSLELVLKEVGEVERFNARVLRDGRQVRGDWNRGLDHYPYSHALDGDRTVHDWKSLRFLKTYEVFGSAEFEIEVYDDQGNTYWGNSKLKNVRSA